MTMGGDNGKNVGEWPEAWMDQLPSAVILVRDGKAIKANRHAAFLFGWKAGLPEDLDWFNGGWLEWRKEDRT